MFLLVFLACCEIRGGGGGGGGGGKEGDMLEGEEAVESKLFM